MNVILHVLQKKRRFKNIEILFIKKISQALPTKLHYRK